ncbi:tryptophan-rich sensory protein [Crossiella sp. SN42]|uniref:TspO/MBR family protein n=1 Tax=Crossiella sp. SN42 TaxID=2944808 RepID=UPI00207C91DF|nr:TspO/MBR family protein [Crossiella sp. SN42]MCO1577317.1 tryptophan-rich sensory protein [Crossiella sp. SN42]
MATATHPTVPRQLGAGAVFAVSVVLAAGLGALAGTSTSADYLALRQPSWAPPSWLFGPVWTVLYAMIAISGWLLWRHTSGPATRSALAAYGVQLALNAAWTPIFFGARLYGLAFAELVLMWVAIGVTVWRFFPLHRTAAVLLLPYWAWVSFAGALNFAIWRLN